MCECVCVCVCVSLYIQAEKKTKYCHCYIFYLKGAARDEGQKIPFSAQELFEDTASLVRSAQICLFPPFQPNLG